MCAIADSVCCPAAAPRSSQACHIPELLARVDLLSEHSRLQGGTGLHYSPGVYGSLGGLKLIILLMLAVPAGNLGSCLLCLPGGVFAPHPAGPLTAAAPLPCRPPRRHIRQPAHSAVCPPVGRRLCGCSDSRDARGGPCRCGGGAPTRPPRREQHRHGLLLLQQCRHRSARGTGAPGCLSLSSGLCIRAAACSPCMCCPCLFSLAAALPSPTILHLHACPCTPLLHAGGGRGPRAHPGLGCAPRQRHAAHL